MKCNCNPSRAEFGGWRGVRRCAVCGKVFQIGRGVNRGKATPELVESDPPAVQAQPQPTQSEEQPVAVFEPPSEPQPEPSIQDEPPPQPLPEQPAQPQPEPEQPQAAPLWGEHLEQEGSVDDPVMWPDAKLTDQLPKDAH